MRNLITDVAGVKVGSAHDGKLASGVTALVFDAPATASLAISGGAPGLRDAALLEADMTVQQIDALVLSGGSAFGLDAVGGVQSALREIGRGFEVAGQFVPIVPGAILFDLANGGDKSFWGEPAYWRLGKAAARAAAADFALGSHGAGLGATLVDLKGGLGSASARTPEGFVVGALVAANAVGQATIGETPHFWAAPYEQGDEFGGLGWPAQLPAGALTLKMKGAAPQNTNIAIVATDATLTKAQAKRMAVMAQDGLARALRPVHAAMDGDTVFSAATGRAKGNVDALALTTIGAVAADCLARAVARAVYEATSLPFAGALPGWREKFAS
ncbi:P1 family peptidase [Rhodoblastus acidophilus]|uniref:P1 family peptidase n=1 Tax=Candidatus Rhodoblastus alkanivorans TaxID=2954117 RepID=A0ABS9Z619_9HYPH|nr:P1 family peptidase [Candidatus Rhodoblastus alkanivorans]MCI4678665.1 P1 family peptidase [Candidatus Rhodoblastus alkanivorans]MCI4683074.1 P1 family peptidase [Candidatus Rhodoblastus alkanivorans]MDI4640385.1 P1 family peptidase [Rhodoblastus acidophilus]